MWNKQVYSIHTIHYWYILHFPHILHLTEIAKQIWFVTILERLVTNSILDATFVTFTGKMFLGAPSYQQCSLHKISDVNFKMSDQSFVYHPVTSLLQNLLPMSLWLIPSTSNRNLLFLGKISPQNLLSHFWFLHSFPRIFCQGSHICIFFFKCREAEMEGGMEGGREGWTEGGREGGRDVKCLNCFFWLSFP